MSTRDKLAKALHALVNRRFTFWRGAMLGADRKITRDEVQAAREALAAHEAELLAESIAGDEAEKQAGPVAEVAENFVFLIRKQPDGSRWPVGTKLFAAPPAVLAVLDQAKAALQTGLGECDPYSPTCEESQAQMNAAIAAIDTLKEAAR